jgi:CarD family transcriptional regulator
MSKMRSEFDFNVGDAVVYPAHGVGRIIDEEVHHIGGSEVKMLVVIFDKDKMTLRVPLARAHKAGLRALSTNEDFDRAIATLKGRAKISKGMWSKRAQEYEGKINSGNVLYLAEVLRDLYRNVDDPNRSYSEKMIYEAALARFTHEYSIAANLNPEDADKKVKEILEEAKIECVA